MQRYAATLRLIDEQQRVQSLLSGSRQGTRQPTAELFLKGCYGRSMSGGNFRLLTRLLTQIERVLSVNDLHLVSNAVVEAARDSLVIGSG